MGKTVEELAAQAGRFRIRVDDEVDGRCILIDTARDGRVVGEDGGSPEDQTLTRDWSWVVDELNAVEDERARLDAAVAKFLDGESSLIEFEAAARPAAGPGAIELRSHCGIDVTPIPEFVRDAAEVADVEWRRYTNRAIDKRLRGADPTADDLQAALAKDIGRRIRAIHPRSPAPSLAGACCSAALDTAARALDELLADCRCGNISGKEARAAVLAVATVQVFPRDAWHEEDGPVLWWFFAVEEPPYAGTPLDDDFPDYVTHWTRIVVPDCPTDAVVDPFAEPESR